LYFRQSSASIAMGNIAQGFVRAKDRNNQATAVAAPAQTATQVVATQPVPASQIPQTAAQASPQPQVQAQEVVKF